MAMPVTRVLVPPNGMAGGSLADERPTRIVNRGAFKVPPNRDSPGRMQRIRPLPRGTTSVVAGPAAEATRGSRQ
jgi:hypothetical protein